jgi:Mlc titration factor MtfA (ptsG expression regulator)/Tfp pilus assembly protein PilF
MIFSSPRRSRREHLLAEPFPQEWLIYLHENVFLYRLLSVEDQSRLRDYVRIFIAEKFWEGCAGVEITDEMRVTVAGNACLLVLGFEDYCFDELQTVLIYPGGFLRTIEDPLGREEPALYLLGEAHSRGPVLLSWWQTQWDSRRLGKTNLVLHEFAHKLGEHGDWVTGIPLMADPELGNQWEEVVEPAFKQLVRDAEYSRPTLLDHYGATNRAEFFAVATECFFMQPIALRRRHFELYQFLAKWFCQDPASWKTDDSISSLAEEVEEEFTRHVIRECTTAIRDFPSYLDAYRIRADRYRQVGESRNALADCDAVIRLSDDDEKALAYYERGMMHSEFMFLEDALADFREAIRRLPDFALAYRALGIVHAAKGDRDQALANLARALRLDPDDDIAMRERARVYRDSREFDKAIRDLTRVIKLAPHVAVAYCDRAWLHIDKQEYEQAIADCDAALRIDPQLGEAYKARGIANEHIGDTH